MFTAFIAVALELVALACGALLLIGACRNCCKGNCSSTVSGTGEYKVGHDTDTKYSDDHCKSDHHKCKCFLRVISFFTMGLSLIALVCTVIALVCFLVNVNRLERDTNAPVEQYNHDLNKLRKYSSNYGLLPRAKENTLVPTPNSDQY